MLKIADKTFESRLFTGTGKFSDQSLMVQAIAESGSQLATMALKRVDLQGQDDNILRPLIENQISLLPNTSGAKNAKDAIFAAHLAREALGTNWLKLEIHPDPKYLLPDPIETLKAAELPAVVFPNFSIFTMIFSLLIPMREAVASIILKFA